MNNEELDRTLKAWADLKRSPPERVDQLAKQICRESRRRQDENRFSGVWCEPVAFWRKARYAAAGAGFAAVVSFLVLWMVLPSAHDAGHGVDAQIRGLAGISVDQLQSCTRLYRELKRLFPYGLQWIAQSDGQVGLGLETSPDMTTPNAVPMIVKVTVLSRKTGERAWRQSWSTELIMNSQERVEVVPDQATENKLALWVYPLEDGKLAVDSSVELRLPVTVASRLNAVVTPGQPAKIAVLALDGIEYGIFQTVDVMKGKI